MKIFFGLVVVLMFIHSCSAGANRSTMWVLANNQMYSTNAGYQFCTTSGSLTATSVSFLTSTKLSVTGKIIGIKGLIADTAAIANSAMVSNLFVVFYYNSSFYLTVSLYNPSVALSISTLVATITSTASTATTGNFISAAPSTYPFTVSGGTRILSPTGSTWLEFFTIQEPYDSAGATGTRISSSILIVDYVSYSTVAISQYSGTGADGTGGGATAATNSFFQFGVRTQTSTITGSNLLTAGCTTSGRKRSLDHLIKKRDLSCPVSGLDASLTASAVSTICTNANSIYAATATATAGTGTKTSTVLADAVNRGVNALNSLYIADMVFSAASSKFTIAANIGVMFALVNILFGHLN